MKIWFVGKGKTSLLTSGSIQALVLFFVALFAVGTAISTRVMTVKNYPYNPGGQILGDEKSEAEKQQEEAKKEEEKKNEEQKKEGEKIVESKKKVEEKKQEEFKIQEQKLEVQKKEFEMQTSSGQKVKIKREDDGTVKIEAENGDIKFKYKFENGVMKIEAENGESNDANLTKEEEEEFASRSGKSSDDVKKISKLSSLPLSLDLTTNSLVVITPAGEKVVTVLPDQAVSKLVESGFMSRLDGTASDSGLVESVKLEVRGEELVYRVKGVKKEKLLGLFDVETPSTVFISAESGDPVAEEKTFFTDIVRLLSF